MPLAALAAGLEERGRPPSRKLGDRPPNGRFARKRTVGLIRMWENLVVPGWPLFWAGGKGALMSYTPETPFDSIEGSHEYVALLAEALAEARRDVDLDIAAAEAEVAVRRKEALLLVSYNLAKLDLHVAASRRILNDLRTLRRLLLAERTGARGSEAEARARSLGEV
jgi:hypothetical protein